MGSKTAPGQQEPVTPPAAPCALLKKGVDIPYLLPIFFVGRPEACNRFRGMGYMRTKGPAAG